MQKKLLGMAVAAALAAPAVALAQSAVQVYGTAHLSFNSSKFGDSTNGVPAVTKFGVNQHASNWGLRSTETLGGGMTGWFQAEFNMPIERTNGVNDGQGTARNSGLGLRGGFGNVYVGTWETPWAQTFRLWDVGTIGGWGPVTSIIGRRETTGGAPSRNCGNLSGAGGSVTGYVSPAPICGQADPGNFSATGNLGYPLWRRFGHSVFYESPVFEGVQVKVAYLPNETKSTVATGTPASPATSTTPAGTATVGAIENPSAWSGSITWTGMGGRARAFIANMRAKDFSAVGNTDSGYTAGGGYDFGVANVGVTYEDYTYKPAAGDVKAKQWGAGVAVPLGPGKIGASYAKAKKLEGTGAPAANDTGAKMWNLGYEWALSKRTALGFGVAKIDNGADVAFSWTGQTLDNRGVTSGTVLSGVDQTNVFVSMRHSF